MRVASYIGFFAMIIVGVGAFLWVDAWWATVLLLLAALAIGWYSLDAYGAASVASAARALRGAASDDDIAELDRMDDRARSYAIQRAADLPDPQRDRIFEDFIEQAGGLEAARQMVSGHLAQYGLYVNEEEADAHLNAWRRYGIVKNQSLGEFLDEAGAL